MRSRWYRASRALCPAVALLAAAALASGCGGVALSGASSLGSKLTVYSSLPLQGVSAASSRQILGGEKLALADAGGQVGQFKVSFYSMDDASPKTGQWDPGITAADAKTAAQDTSTIAYIGDYNSAASAVSLPLINAAGVLQVSPASPYVGLTSSLDAGQDEPERFYPTGKRNFGRLMPADPVQAAAQVALMRALHVRRVYAIDDLDPFQAPLAQIVVEEARRAGIQAHGPDGIDTGAEADFSGEIEKIRASGAGAVFFSGGTGPGVVRLWRELHAADPGLLLLGPSTMVDAAFAREIGTAAQSTYLTTPLLPSDAYPASAQRVLARYRAQFGERAGPWALYGYEAMSVVLQAIRDAGPHGNERRAVIERFFAIRDRESVLGRYSVEANGDSSSTRYGVQRIADGKLVFWRALDLG